MTGVAFSPAAHLDQPVVATHLGQAEIEQHAVVFVLAAQGQQLAAIGGPIDRMAIAQQEAADRASQDIVVFSQQQAHFGWGLVLIDGRAMQDRLDPLV